MNAVINLNTIDYLVASSSSLLSAGNVINAGKRIAGNLYSGDMQITKEYTIGGNSIEYQKYSHITKNLPDGAQIYEFAGVLTSNATATPKIDGKITLNVNSSIKTDLTAINDIVVDPRLNLLPLLTTSNTFEYVDVANKFTNKFNWQADQKIYAPLQYIYCSNSATCNAAAYDAAILIGNTSEYTAINAKLSNFNEMDDVLRLKMLNPDIMPNANMKYVQSDFIDVVFTYKPESGELQLADNQTILDVFKSDPNKFTRAPSNVYGYGVLDLKQAAVDLNYQLNTAPDIDIMNSQKSINNLQFYYNSKIEPSPELNIMYNSNTMTAANSNNRIVLDDYKVSTVAGQVGIDLTNNIMTSGQNQMFLSGIMSASGSLGVLSNIRNVSLPRFLGIQLSAITNSMSNNVSIYGQGALHASQMGMYGLASHATNLDMQSLLMLYNGQVPYIHPVGGLSLDQDIAGLINVKVMTFGNKNLLSLINQNSIANTVCQNGISFISGQQSMFDDPYYRIAGLYTSTMYSASTSFGEGKFAFAYNVVDSMSLMSGFNPMFMSGMNYAMGSTNVLNSGNRVDYVNILMHSDDRLSAYSIGFGKVYENNSFLGGLGTGAFAFGGANTNYVDAKIVQNIISSDYYFMFHMSVGQTNVRGDKNSIISNFSSVVTRKLSLGFAKDNFFGGTVAVLYNEPNRIISGNALISETNVIGGNSIVTWNGMNLSSSTYERNQELLYSRGGENHSIGFNFIHRQNPYGIHTIDHDYAFLVRMQYMM